MAHEIDFTTGRPAIAYVGGVPWHGYGEQLDPDVDLDTWRVAAGLDWNVEEYPVFWKNPETFPVARDMEIPNRKVLTRSDTRDTLSIVGDRYNVVQPEEVLEFFRDLIDREGFKMHTAGALKDGKRIWALADTGKDFSIGGDAVEAYLLLATSYDGTFATTAQFTSIRVVCNNTLGFAMNGESSGVIKIPHNQDFNDVRVKAELGLNESWSNFYDNVLQLSEHKVTKKQALDYFLTLMGVTEEEAADGKQLSNVKKLITFYEEAPGSQLITAKNTAWGLVNAVTYFTDHGRRARNEGTRFDSASFGSGAKLKRDALQNALELAA